ncbi:hypothetical protein DEI81_09920 [Curtobacterium sp. MCBD17_013]|uniref:hypothetical protein n=1 Tax=Curtobacterium sp. MCBD17_013 TaxID=2175668 RepID=UPI000DA743DA|nr:hypothetical protein [Curtobacterium sp. MCBD17_013]PZF61714.1 hypothetical protein DEI81_09920 [Curtobacterium sp. MCBD17_013]
MSDDRPDQQQPRTLSPATASEDRLGSPSRRSIVLAGAWSVPAIALATATPAHAASDSATITVSFADSAPRAPGSSLADGTATVRSGSGVPLPNETVVLTVSGPASFGSPGTTTITVTTDAAGQATAAGLTAGTTNGTVTLTATVTGAGTATATISVLHQGVLHQEAAVRFPAATGAFTALASNSTSNNRYGVAGVTSTGEVWTYYSGTNTVRRVATGADPSIAPAIALRGNSNDSFTHYVKGGVALNDNGSPLFPGVPGPFTHLTATSTADNLYCVVAVTSAGAVWRYFYGNTSSSVAQVASDADPTIPPVSAIRSVSRDSSQVFVTRDGVLHSRSTADATPFPTTARFVGASATSTLANHYAFVAVTSTGEVWRLGYRSSAPTLIDRVATGADPTVTPVVGIRSDANDHVPVWVGTDGRAYSTWSSTPVFPAATGRFTHLAADAEAHNRFAVVGVTTTGEVWRWHYGGNNSRTDDYTRVLTGADPAIAPGVGLRDDSNDSVAFSVTGASA